MVSDVNDIGMMAMMGVSLRWFKEFFGSVMWTLSMKNSFIIAGATTVLATALGTLSAVGLTMANFPFKGIVTGIMIMPMVVPIVITAVGIYFFFAWIGLASTHFGIILAHTALATPFVVITVTATLQGFNRNQIRIELTARLKTICHNGLKDSVAS